MKLSQRLQQLAASLVQPDKPFEPGQIVVYKSLFIEAGENTWSRLMVIMPQPPQMERVSRMQGAYWSRDNQPAQRVCVGVYHHLGTDYGLADVDPRHIRLATEDEIKRGDALAYERALDNLKAHQHRQPLGNIAWMTQKEGHPIDSWHVRPVIVESTWAGGGMEFGGQLGENRSEVHMDRHGRELPNKRDDVNIKEPLSEAVKPLGLDDGDVVTGAYETINWESFNDRFARAITVKEELAIATEYATKLLSVPLITFPIQNEILVLSHELSIINNSAYADETYVVIDRRDQLVATLVAESIAHKRYDIKVDEDINNVVIINVKDSRVISVNIYTK